MIDPSPPKSSPTKAGLPSSPSVSIWSILKRVAAVDFLCKGKELSWEGIGSHLGVCMRSEDDSGELVISFTLALELRLSALPSPLHHPYRLLPWVLMCNAVAFWPCAQSSPFHTFPPLPQLHPDFCLWILPASCSPSLPLLYGKSLALLPWFFIHVWLMLTASLKFPLH